MFLHAGDLHASYTSNFTCAISTVDPITDLRNHNIVNVFLWLSPTVSLLHIIKTSEYDPLV